MAFLSTIQSIPPLLFLPPPLSRSSHCRNSAHKIIPHFFRVDRLQVPANQVQLPASQVQLSQGYLSGLSIDCEYCGARTADRISAERFPSNAATFFIWKRSLARRLRGPHAIQQLYLILCLIVFSSPLFLLHVKFAGNRENELTSTSMNLKVYNMPYVVLARCVRC